MKRRICSVGAGFAALTCLVLAIAGPSDSGARSDESRGTKKSGGTAPPAAIGPQYNEAGELKRPAGFETWVFVGSNLGIEYGEDAKKERPVEKKEAAKPAKGANFHNVYINPEAYAHYARTGKFPQKTVLVLDIFKAEEREPGKIVSEGLFPGAHAGLAVAVKNSARPDGSQTDWAYYDFGLEGKTARAFLDKACYDCHLNHADDDNVWVQFYPTLRTLRERK
jgi:hypothetical protein